MGRQKGTQRFSGSIGKITYVNHPLYGYLARERTGPSKERINSDPAYAEQKKNTNIFGGVSSGCKLIRKCFKPVIDYAGDSIINTRLMTPGRVIYKEGMLAEADHPYHTNLMQQLKGFRFNAAVALDNILIGEPIVVKSEGSLMLNIDNTEIKETGGATHYRIGCSLGSLDFVQKIYTIRDEGSDILPINTTIGYRCDFEIAEEYPVHMLVVGVILYTEVNGAYYRLNNSEFATAEIVEVMTEH